MTQKIIKSNHGEAKNIIVMATIFMAMAIAVIVLAAMYFNQQSAEDTVVNKQDNNVPAQKEAQEVQKEGSVTEAGKAADEEIKDKEEGGGLTVAMCGEMADTRHKMGCLKVAVEGIDDAAECAMLAGDKYDLDWCYFFVAKATNNAEPCGKIACGHIEYDCYKMIASATQDAGVCDKIVDEELRGGCLGVVEPITEE